jgi:non-ribosomal peptide synthetase component E (peptide arylation enzyme)
VTGDAIISYRQLQHKVERLAAGLHRLGILAGDVVVVQLPNIAEFLIAYLAICRLGAVMSTAHMTYRGTELRTLLSHGRARCFIGLGRMNDASPTGIVLELKDDLPLLDHIITVGDPPEGALSWSDLLAAVLEPLPESIVPVPSDPSLLLFTSGTTASPKAVPLTYQNTLGNARMSAPEHSFTASDLALSVAPYTHLFGLYSFHLALSVGAANAMLPKFTPNDLAAALNDLRPTVLFAAPAHLAAMLATGAFDGTDLTSVRLIIASGGACSPDIVREIAARLPNGKFTQLWGMTETQAGLYTRPNDSIDISATTVGRPSPGTEVRVVDPEDRPLVDGEIGELQIRGSLLFPGYFANEEVNRDAFAADNWFRSGDLAARDSSGNVRITGRIKDLINRGGVKYNPRDVEDAIALHPKVSQVAIVSMPDNVLGERACCFVVARDGAPPTLKELCAGLTELGIAKHKLPERLVVIDEMPKTPTGKIVKSRLRELL